MLVAVNLVPFAGIAFLWFIGVIRDRLGQREDRFFATVFLGSGLLFVAMLFAASAVTVSLATGFRGGVHSSADSVQTWRFGGSLAHALLTTFGMRMAAVFMISTATLTYRSGVVPRWLGLAGYACALALLVGVNVVGWLELLFPLWVLLISSYFLIENRRPQSSGAGGLGQTPSSAATSPEPTASTSRWWSRSFWSAYLEENSAIARSKRGPRPR